LITYKAPTIL